MASLTYPSEDMTLETTEFTDKVCVNTDNCASAFQFYAVTSQTGMSAYSDGILGLQPVLGNSVGGPSYINALQT